VREQIHTFLTLLTPNIILWDVTSSNLVECTDISKASSARIMVRFPKRARDLSFCQSVCTDSGIQPVTYQWITPTVSTQDRRPRREASHSSPPPAETKNEWSHTSVPPICLQLLHRNNLAVLLPVSFFLPI
jgi:hypothetical protein